METWGLTCFGGLGIRSLGVSKFRGLGFRGLGFRVFRVLRPLGFT